MQRGFIAGVSCFVVYYIHFTMHEQAATWLLTSRLVSQTTLCWYGGATLIIAARGVNSQRVWGCFPRISFQVGGNAVGEPQSQKHP